MKYFLIIFLAFLLFSCAPRTTWDNRFDISLLSQPENFPKPIITRTYHFQDGLTIMSSEPADCIINAEIKMISQLGSKAVVPNLSYWLPSRSFVENKLLPKYRKHLKDSKLTYNNKFDCVNFSRDFCVFSQDLYTKIVVNKTEQDICVGEIYYIPEETIADFMRKALNGLSVNSNKPTSIEPGHAINIIILDDLSIMYVEPQLGTEVFLTENEVRNICYGRF